MSTHILLESDYRGQLSEVSGYLFNGIPKISYWGERQIVVTDVGVFGKVETTVSLNEVAQKIKKLIFSRTPWPVEDEMNATAYLNTHEITPEERIDGVYAVTNLKELYNESDKLLSSLPLVTKIFLLIREWFQSLFGPTARECICNPRYHAQLGFLASQGANGTEFLDLGALRSQAAV